MAPVLSYLVTLRDEAGHPGRSLIAVSGQSAMGRERATPVQPKQLREARPRARAKPDCLAAQPGLNLRLVPTGCDRPAVDAGLTREPVRKFTGLGEQDFANSRASRQSRGRPGPLAVERHDHHHRCDRSRRRDYLRSRRYRPVAPATSCHRYVRHVWLDVGSLRSRRARMMMRDDPPGRPEVSPSVAANLVELRYDPSRDRRIGRAG